MKSNIKTWEKPEEGLPKKDCNCMIAYSEYGKLTLSYGRFYRQELGIFCHKERKEKLIIKATFESRYEEDYVEFSDCDEYIQHWGNEHKGGINKESKLQFYMIINSPIKEVTNER